MYESHCECGLGVARDEHGVSGTADELSVNTNRTQSGRTVIRQGIDQIDIDQVEH